MMFKEGINYSDYKLIRDMLREHKRMLINNKEFWENKIKDSEYDAEINGRINMYQLKQSMVDRILKAYFELEDKDIRVNI